LDLDNKKAIEEFCTREGVTVSLDEIAKKFIIEQHLDGPNKCHVFFYSEIPFEKKSSDIVTTTLDTIKTPSPESIPAFEVKGKGTHGIAYVIPSFHKNGHRYEIIGTTEPILLNPSAAHGMMDHLDAICRKHKLKYLKDSSSSIGVYGDDGQDNNNNNKKVGAHDSATDELFQDGAKIYEGHNRHLGVLRAAESLLRRFHKDFSEDEIKKMTWEWNEKHCIPPLDEREFERQWRDAKKFITRKLQEQKQEEEEQQPTVQGRQQQQQQRQPQPKIEATPDLTRELTYEETAVILSTSIKKDKPTKVISFSGMLLTQTNEDQLNIGYQAESSSGKSWIPRALCVFPRK
jgi:hypothetical protein